jgi:hypothetical protein
LGNHARRLGPLAALLLTISGGIAHAESEQAAVVATEATDVDAASLARVLEETRAALAGTGLESRLTPQAAQAALEAAGLRPRACGLSSKCIAKLGKALQVQQEMDALTQSLLLLGKEVEYVDGSGAGTLTGVVEGVRFDAGLPTLVVAGEEVLPGDVLAVSQS